MTPGKTPIKRMSFQVGKSSKALPITFPKKSGVGKRLEKLIMKIEKIMAKMNDNNEFEKKFSNLLNIGLIGILYNE